VLTTKTSKLSLIIDGVNNSEVVLLLHGGPGVPDYLNKIGDFLKKDFKVIRFDQRGVGNSIALNNQYDIKYYLDDINEILEFIKVEKIHIFGHSWGGLLAQIYTSQYPNKIKSLFLCSPSSGSGDVWKAMEKEVMLYNKQKATSFEWLNIGLNSLLGLIGIQYGYKNIFRLLWSYYFKIPKEAPKADENWLLGINAQAINKTRKSIITMNNDEIILSNINIPAIVTFGKYDIYGESKVNIYKRLPNIKKVTFNNAGHLPWIQDEKEFSSVMSKFYDNFKLNS